MGCGERLAGRPFALSRELMDAQQVTSKGRALRAASLPPSLPHRTTGHPFRGLSVSVRPSGWGADMARTCQLGWLGVWLKTIGPEELALR
jgi:hypothetical protein